MVEDGLSCVAFEAAPVFRWAVEDVVQLESWGQLFQLLSKQDVLLCFVGEEKDELNVFILHFLDFPDDLVARSDSASSGHEEDAFEVMLLPI